MTDYQTEGFDPAAEGFDLPYAYTDNNRAGSLPITIGIALLTPLMGVTNYFGFTSLHWFIVLLPIFLIIVRQSVYQLLVNAIHEAIRCGQSDALLDAEMAAQSAPVEEEDESVLDAKRFEAALKKHSPLLDPEAY